MDVFHAPPDRSPGELTTRPDELARLVVEAAVQAPSVHNTQPWRFRASESEISVYTDPSRQLRVADPRGRELLVSCGAAVFTMRVALRQAGVVPTVSVLPDADQPDLVARVTWGGQVPPVEYERQLFTEIARRRTHRGGFSPEPLPRGALEALREEAALEGAMLRVLAQDEQRAALAAVVEAGERALRLDGARAQEEARWAPPPGSLRRDGVPPTGYPARPPRTEPYFPSRDFARGHGWGIRPHAPGQLSRSAGVVCILATSVDEPRDWVQAGQALQRVLLCASSFGVAAAMHSQPLELTTLREFIRVELSGRAHPQMVLRFGATSQTAVSFRRPVEEVLL
jgi:Nitroreductase family